MFKNRRFKVQHHLRSRSNQKANYWTRWVGSRCFSNQCVGSRDWYRSAWGRLGSWIKNYCCFGPGTPAYLPSWKPEFGRKICQQGALASEFLLATKLVSDNLPIRNRVISGISQGVFVTEVSIKSGALITATLSQEQNRKVFAVPGSVDSYPSSGYNQLFQGTGRN